MDGWYIETDSIELSNTRFIDVEDGTLILKQGINFFCWQPDGKTIVGYDDGEGSVDFKVRQVTNELNANNKDHIPTVQAVTTFVDAKLVDYTPTTPDWNAAEGEPGYIKNKPFETTSSGDSTPDLVLDESTIIGKEENVSDGHIIATGMFESEFMVVHGQTYTLIYTLYNGTQIKNKVTAMYGYELNPDPDYGQKDAIHLSDSVNGLAVISGGGMVIYQHPDFYSKIEIYIGEPNETSKIQNQYIETVNKITELTGDEEIPNVRAIRDFIQQAINESLYIDEEDYV